MTKQAKTFAGLGVVVAVNQVLSIAAAGIVSTSPLLAAALTAKPVTLVLAVHHSSDPLLAALVGVVRCVGGTMLGVGLTRKGFAASSEGAWVIRKLRHSPRRTGMCALLLVTAPSPTSGAAAGWSALKGVSVLGFAVTGSVLRGALCYAAVQTAFVSPTSIKFLERVQLASIVVLVGGVITRWVWKQCSERILTEINRQTT
jgi:hypothetical protein